MRIILLFFLLLFFCFSIEAGIIKVPDQYSKIQLAINASANGDTVLVAPGRYTENLNFMGKKIVLTSRYYLDNNPAVISSTIIDGSSPRHPDTASCVIFISGEDSSTVLQGFTITGGKGTVWVDEHGAGTYREGGGILIALSSPVIRHNVIVNNEAINKSGLQSAGGGGIRLGDARPSVIANLIINNRALYGGGIVMNYSAAYVMNNIIYHNSGGQDFGGGGVWINGRHGITTFNLLENNTIAGNYSETDGGGVLIWQTKAIMNNNIIWGNMAATSGPNLRFRPGGTALMSYNNIEGGAAGSGNINLNPLFQENSRLMLSEASPCIDAGMEGLLYNDPQDPSNPQMAKSPSRGMIRNDIGAYGGRNRIEFPDFSAIKLYFPLNLLSYRNVAVGDSVTLKLTIQNMGDIKGRIDSIKSKTKHFSFKIKNNLPFEVNIFRKDTLTMTLFPLMNGTFNDTLYLYHNDKASASPKLIFVSGSAVTDVEYNPAKAFSYSLEQNYPNPFNPSTNIRFTLQKGEMVTLGVYNLLGQEVRSLLNEFRNAGVHTVQWNGKDNSGKNLASGLYIYRLKAGIFTSARQMMLIK